MPCARDVFCRVKQLGIGFHGRIQERRLSCNAANGEVEKKRRISSNLGEKHDALEGGGGGIK